MRGGLLAILLLAGVAAAQQADSAEPLRRALDALREDGAEAALQCVRTVPAADSRTLLAALVEEARPEFEGRPAAFLPLLRALADETAPDRSEAPVPAALREAGLRAARECHERVRVGAGPSALARSRGRLGMHLLAAGAFEAARKELVAAGEWARGAEKPAEALYFAAGEALARVMAGAGGPQAASRIRDAIRELTERHGAAGDGLSRRIRLAVANLEAPLAGLADRAPVRIVSGPLVLTLARSRTAQLFHLVDQLSEWDPHVRPHWRAAFALSEEDHAALARYRQLRREKGWGGGLEETLYTENDLDAALFAGVREERITPPQAVLLRDVLERFARRADRLYLLGARGLDIFVSRLDRELLDRAVVMLSGLTGVRSLEVFGFLVASPAGGAGGGMNGGRLVVEIPRNEDVTFILLHEIAHAFFRERSDAIEAAAAMTVGLDAETLAEALAYAVAPGLFHRRDGDPLADRVREHRERGESLTGEDDLARSRILALLIRPTLRQGGSLDAALREACAAFLAAKNR